MLTVLCLLELVALGSSWVWTSLSQERHVTQLYWSLHKGYPLIILRFLTKELSSFPFIQVLKIS